MFTNPFARSATTLQDPAVAQHPLMRQVLADVEEQQRQVALEQQAQQQQQAQLRADQISHQKREIDILLDRYEVLRKQTRDVLRELYMQGLILDRVTSTTNDLIHPALTKVNLPPARPDSFAPLHPVYSSMEADIQTYYANGGKWS